MESRLSRSLHPAPQTPRTAPLAAETSESVDETPFFFEVEGQRVFAIWHCPSNGTPTAGLVLCHALAEEKHRSHRAMVGLARELADAGMAVLRFEFRGEGDSDLDFEESGIATRVADAVSAAEVLLERQPQLGGAVLLGYRLGAVIAAAAASRLGARARAVVLWDPVTDGHAYLLEMLRSTLASRLALVGRAPTRAALIAALEAGENVNIEGYAFSPRFYRELDTLHLESLLSRLQCPSLHIDPGDGPAPWRESKYHCRGAPDVARRAREWLERCT